MARWLVLTGYMGAGKTSVGRRVANRLGRTFTDADRVIEEQAGMPIPEIFCGAASCGSAAPRSA